MPLSLRFLQGAGGGPDHARWPTQAALRLEWVFWRHNHQTGTGGGAASVIMPREIGAAELEPERTATERKQKPAAAQRERSSTQVSVDKLSFIEGVMEPRIYWELTMLIIFGGLPGTGKTTIARELARELGAVHVRIDSIEEAILDSGVLSSPINDAGYRVGYAVAADNLRIGRTVIQTQ